MEPQDTPTQEVLANDTVVGMLPPLPYNYGVIFLVPHLTFASELAEYQWIADNTVVSPYKPQIVKTYGTFEVVGIRRVADYT